MRRGWVLRAVGAAVLGVLIIGLELGQPSLAAVGNLLQNPSFEAGDDRPSGWTIDTSGELQRVTATPTADGSAVAAVTAKNSPARLMQLVGVVGGSPYTVSTAARLAAGIVESVEFELSWFDDAGGTFLHRQTIGTPLTLGPTFQVISDTITAPSAARSVRLALVVNPPTSGSGTVWFDDVHFDGEVPAVATATPTPIPSTATVTPTPTPSATTAVPTATRTATPAPGTPSATPTPTVAPGWDLIRITEVLVNPAGTQADPDAEWFELFNAGQTAINLTGGTIADNRSADPLPGISLPAGGAIVIGATEAAQQTWTSSNVPFAVLVDGRIGNGLSNTGDHLELRDPAGRIVDTISWGDDRTAPGAPEGTIGDGKTIGRQLFRNGLLDPSIIVLPSMSPGWVTVSNVDGPTPTPSPTLTATPSPTATPATFVVQPSGGIVVFDEGRVTLTVPPGAVDGAVLLTYATRSWPDPADGYRTVVGIELLGNRIPGGAAFTQFAHEVTLSYQYESHEIEGMRPATLALFEIAAGIRRTATTNRADRIVTAPFRNLGVLVFAGETERSFLPIAVAESSP